MYFLTCIGQYSGRFGSSFKHLKACIDADKHYRCNAERMKNSYLVCKNMKKFNVGDLVSVRIPRIDQARTDT